MRRRTLREARRRARLTQTQLETLSGVRQSVISRLEGGVYANPSFAVVIQLAAALHVDPRTLRFGQRKPTAVSA